MENPRLYVGNLPYIAQQVDVEIFFAQNGVSIKRVDFSTDPFTGRNPSFCFVELADGEDPVAVKGLLENKILRGRPVRINYATEHRTKSSCRNGQLNNVKDNAIVDLKGNSQVFDRWSRSDAPDHWTMPSYENRRLYVGGMSKTSGQDVVNQQMRELFRGFEIQAVSKIIWPHASKRALPSSHFYCFVDLPTVQEAETAAELLNGRVTPNGGSYEVRISAQRRPWKVVREQLNGVLPMHPSKTQKRNLEGNWRCLDATS